MSVFAELGGASFGDGFGGGGSDWTNKSWGQSQQYSSGSGSGRGKRGGSRGRGTRGRGRGGSTSWGGDDYQSSDNSSMSMTVDQDYGEFGNGGDYTFSADSSNNWDQYGTSYSLSHKQSRRQKSVHKNSNDDSFTSNDVAMDESYSTPTTTPSWGSTRGRGRGATLQTDPFKNEQSYGNSSSFGGNTQRGSARGGRGGTATAHRGRGRDASAQTANYYQDDFPAGDGYYEEPVQKPAASRKQQNLAKYQSRQSFDFGGEEEESPAPVQISTRGRGGARGGRGGRGGAQKVSSRWSEDVTEEPELTYTQPTRGARGGRGSARGGRGAGRGSPATGTILQRNKSMPIVEEMEEEQPVRPARGRGRGNDRPVSTVGRGARGGRGGTATTGQQPRQPRQAPEFQSRSELEAEEGGNGEVTPADDPNNMTLFIKFANGIPEDWKANPSQFESILRRAAGPGMTTYKVNPMGTTATVNFSTKKAAKLAKTKLTLQLDRNDNGDISVFWFSAPGYAGRSASSPSVDARKPAAPRNIFSRMSSAPAQQDNDDEEDSDDADAAPVPVPAAGKPSIFSRMGSVAATPTPATIPQMRLTVPVSEEESAPEDDEVSAGGDHEEQEEQEDMDEPNPFLDDSYEAPGQGDDEEEEMEEEHEDANVFGDDAGMSSDLEAAADHGDMNAEMVEDEDEEESSQLQFNGDVVLPPALPPFKDPVYTAAERAKRAAENVIEGKLMTLESRGEFEERVEAREIIFTELDPKTGQPKFERAVRKYHRPAADKQPTEDMVRPPRVLEQAFDYLVGLLDQQFRGRTMLELHSYLRDRIRQINQDYIVQHISDTRAIRFHQRALRYFVSAAYEHVEAKAEDFEPRMNLNLIHEHSQKLKEAYKALFQTGVAYPAAGEAFALMLILNVSQDESEFVTQLARLPRYVQNSQEVQVAVEIAAQFASQDLVGLVRVLEQKATYLQACAATHLVHELQVKVFRNLYKAYSNKQSGTIPMSVTSRMLSLDHRQAREFIATFGIALTSDGWVPGSGIQDRAHHLTKGAGINFRLQLVARKRRGITWKRLIGEGASRVSPQFIPLPAAVSAPKLEPIRMGLRASGALGQQLAPAAISAPARAKTPPPTVATAPIFTPPASTSTQVSSITFPIFQPQGAEALQPAHFANIFGQPTSVAAPSPNKPAVTFEMFPPAADDLSQTIDSKAQSPTAILFSNEPSSSGQGNTTTLSRTWSDLPSPLTSSTGKLERLETTPWSSFLSDGSSSGSSMGLEHSITIPSISAQYDKVATRRAGLASLRSSFESHTRKALLKQVFLSWKEVAHTEVVKNRREYEEYRERKISEQQWRASLSRQTPGAGQSKESALAFSVVNSYRNALYDNHPPSSLPFGQLQLALGDEGFSGMDFERSARLQRLQDEEQQAHNTAWAPLPIPELIVPVLRIGNKQHDMFWKVALLVDAPEASVSPENWLKTKFSRTSRAMRTSANKVARANCVPVVTLAEYSCPWETESEVPGTIHFCAKQVLEAGLLDYQDLMQELDGTQAVLFYLSSPQARASVLGYWQEQRARLENLISGLHPSGRVPMVVLYFPGDWPDLSAEQSASLIKSELRLADIPKNWIGDFEVFSLLDEHVEDISNDPSVYLSARQAISAAQHLERIVTWLASRSPHPPALRSFLLKDSIEINIQRLVSELDDYFCQAATQGAVSALLQPFEIVQLFNNKMCELAEIVANKNLTSFNGPAPELLADDPKATLRVAPPSWNNFERLKSIRRSIRALRLPLPAELPSLHQSPEVAQHFIMKYLCSVFGTTKEGSRGEIAIDTQLRSLVLEVFRYHYTTTSTSKLAYVPWHRIMEHVFFHRIATFEEIAVMRCALPQDDYKEKLGLSDRRDQAVYSLSDVYKFWSEQAQQQRQYRSFIDHVAAYRSTTTDSTPQSPQSSTSSSDSATPVPLTQTKSTMRAIEVFKAQQDRKREKLHELLNGIESEAEKWRRQRADLDEGLKSALSLQSRAVRASSSDSVRSSPRSSVHSISDFKIHDESGLDAEDENVLDPTSPVLDRARRLQAKKRSQEYELAQLLNKSRKYE